jgi:Signal transduction histidine kinase
LQKDGGEIYVYLAKVKDEYVLRISDNGKGYDNEDFKNDSLGLKLVEALVISQLDGSIEVQSDDRFGYTIKFEVSSQ